MRIQIDHTIEQGRPLEKLLEKMGARTIMTGRVQTEASFRNAPLTRDDDSLKRFIENTLTDARPAMCTGMKWIA